MLGKRSRINRQLRHNKDHKSPDYYASCHGKIRHATYEEAAQAAAEKPSIVKPYKCRLGDHYHMGRKESR